MSGDANDTAAYHREMQRLYELRRTTMPDLDALEGLAAEATPRPWAYRVSGDAVYLDADRGRATRGIAASIHSERDEANFALIVAAVNALPELLALARLSAAKGSE